MKEFRAVRYAVLVSRFGRLLLVACLTAAFLTGPWRSAFAGEREAVPASRPAPSPGEGTLWRSALALVPSEARLMRQSVASTNESKLLVGVIAGAAMLTGITMTAYGVTSTCKGSQGNNTDTCERLAITGAIGMGAGITTLVLWALSR